MTRTPVILLVCFAGLAACGGDSPPAAPEPAAVTETAPAAPPGPLVIAAPGADRSLADVTAAWREETGNSARLVDVAGRASADLFVANSVADIWAFAEDDELRPVYSAVVDANIDTSLRDSESRWVGLATRARIVIYNDTLVTDDEVATLQNYASLRDERWRGRLCLSSSRSGGNRLLIAHLINTHGVREAETIARGWRANLATTIFADDDALLAAMAAGDCAIGIADSNRIYAIPGSTDVSAHWFSAPDATVIDASVAAVSRHANDAAGAQQMLEWLTTPTPNALFAIRQLDLPANADAPSSSTVADLPVTRGSAPVPLSELGFLLEEADLLRERARYP